ncbi:hypothetical protein CR513_11311, partial [Mucuna pruriens]
MDAKRLKGTRGKPRVRQTDDHYHRLGNHSISAYRIFMESFSRGCKMKNYLEMDRAGFDKWKSMSDLEKQPYVCHARILDYNQEEALDREVQAIKRVLRKLLTEVSKLLFMVWEDVVRDGADSAMVGKFDKGSQSNLMYIESSDSDSKDSEDTESSSSGLPCIMELEDYSSVLLADLRFKTEDAHYITYTQMKSLRIVMNY